MNMRGLVINVKCIIKNLAICGSLCCRFMVWNGGSSGAGEVVDLHI